MIIIENKNNSLNLESDYLQHSFKKIINFAWQNKWKLLHIMENKNEKSFGIKCCAKMSWLKRKIIQKLSFFSKYCGKSRNLTTVKKMNADLVGAYHSKVKLRRKIDCKLWLKICSLLSCTTIRNGGQIYILCSICSCTKISATHTKTVEITSDKNRKCSQKFHHT